MKNTDLLKAREAVKLHTQKKSPLVTKSIAEVLDNEKACKKRLKSVQKN